MEKTNDVPHKGMGHSEVATTPSACTTFLQVTFLMIKEGGVVSTYTLQSLL